MANSDKKPMELPVMDIQPSWNEVFRYVLSTIATYDVHNLNRSPAETQWEKSFGFRVVFPGQKPSRIEYAGRLAMCHLMENLSYGTINRC